jgi:hypothetical protein
MLRNWKTAGTGTIVPVVEVQAVEELGNEFPAGVPVIHLIRAPVELRSKESSQLHEEGTGMPAGITFEVHCTAFRDRSAASSAVHVFICSTVDKSHGECLCIVRLSWLSMILISYAQIHCA